MSERHEKAEENTKPIKRKKPPGWKNFQKVLKRVITAPPLKRRARESAFSDPPESSEVFRENQQE